MDFIFKVDPIRRNIKVPDGFTVLTMDHNVHKLVFVCPYYEDFAFDSASIVFMIDAPDGKQYIIPAEDYESFPNSPAPYVKFTLTLKSYITSVVGYMSFCITADIISSGNVIEKSWHSKNVSISIGGHIDNDDSEDIPEEDVPTINQRLNNLDSKVGRLQTTVNGMANGSPTPVSTVAEMTDESAVYLYTGSETGYTAGNWYYYNGSAWTSGGTYGGAVTDTTLSISGKPADAKAVGDALAEKADSNDVTALEESIEAMEDDVDGRLNDIKSSLQQDVYNFINYPSTQVTDKGITFTPNGDEIVISGTATGNAWFRLYNRAEFPFGVENGKQYYISVNQDDSEEYGLYLKIYYYKSNDADACLIANMNNGYFIFPHDAIGYALTLVVPQGVTLNNVTVRPIMCELGNIKKILDNATKDTKSNLYTNLRYQTATSNGITFTTNGNSIVLNGTSGDGNPRFTLCDSRYSLLYGLVSGKSYWFDVGLKDKTKVNYVYINLSFYLSDGTHTAEIGIKGPTKITVPTNAVGFYMVLMTQKKGLVIADNTVVSPGIYMVNPMAESRILEQAVSASENVISINGNYVSYKDFDLYGVFLNRVTGREESNSTWRSGYIPIPFAGKYQIFQNYGQFGNTYLNVPLYDKNKRFIKSITGVDSAFRNIIEVTISESDLYDGLVYYIGLTYEPTTNNPEGIPMFMYNVDYPSDQRFIEPKYSVYKPYQPPMISIIDDDGASDFLTKLLPIIESKNIPMTSAVVTSFADTERDGFMTWEEIVDANNRGAEFISHTDTHLFNPASIEDAQMNYLRSFNKLRAHGVINDRNILVYAGASASLRNALVGARRIADGAIDSSGNSMNYRGGIDAWKIKRYRIDADYQYDLDSMKELIDDCKSNGGWMIWMIHCAASEWDKYNAGTSFPQAIDYAIQRGVQIATVNHGFKTYVD